ncbi:LexA family transcriptional regulator [Mesonia aestuariivivens]|uniref:XRE family transcriptional regulator n=1 Tax=Mesonia aestuariivivens TaxID=2796128 RepID=A0ABS6W0D6_9FLAO|nr:XRE family transcriptional regulator [Mesonia aestuariivivens]MBW2961308.1 XRE family transcriptional regulator [Mesonia aestuariivivens]
MKSIENNISELSKRFLYLIKEKGYSGYKISKEVDVITQSKLTFIRKGRNEPSKDLINAILNKFPDVNPAWLLTGEGSMLKGEQTSEPSKEYNKEAEPKGVPYFDLDFTAGFASIINNQQTQPDTYVTHPFFSGCDYIVRASGQSMAKIIKHGDAIGLTKINNWQEFIPMGEVYAIVTNNGFRMIKVITKGKDDNHYTLISKPSESKKEEFPPQQIKKSTILSIYKVQASSHLF